MQIKARFFVQSITRTNAPFLGVVLQPVLRATDDNVSWSKYTPSGKLEMSVSRETPAAAEFERALDLGADISITLEVIEPTTDAPGPVR